MTPKLKSLTVSNFRSIRGEITVPLDAPVVLIHGHNGAGKTSILSAIELALTGAASSLGRGDANYVTHLPHKLNNRGEVTLTVEGLGKTTNTANLVVEDGKILNTPLLDAEHVRFFTERCYLAQSMLARLLELYEHQDTRKSESALTKFVKDLLGLDRLESLIDGLYPAGDVRRLRSSAPTYWSAREDIPIVERELKKSRAERQEFTTSIEYALEQLEKHFAVLFPNQNPISESPESALSLLEADNEESRLQAVARNRRDLLAARSQWALIVQSANSAEWQAIEVREREARLASEMWDSAAGQDLKTIYHELMTLFPYFSPTVSAGPATARKAAYEVAAAELVRCQQLLEKDSQDQSLLTSVNRNIEQGRARLAVLETQLEDSSSITEGLAQLLAELVPHVHSEDCPVCGRDYQEISPLPLRAHVLQRVAQLTQKAGRLQALAKDKAATAGVVASAERERGALIGRLIPPEDRDGLKTRNARLAELTEKLERLENTAIAGEELQRRAQDAARHHTNFRSLDDRASALRSSLEEVISGLALSLGTPDEPLNELIERLLQVVEAKENTLLHLQQTRKAALSQIKTWESAEKRKSILDEQIEKTSKKLLLLNEAKNEADRRLDVAKSLANSARDARTAIVRQVFNEKLNKVWKDLFIRLAPEEPFVPAFALPDPNGGAVEAILETLYRAGGKGGNPRSMLSAGNLNTAALTLFLSLHLSVKPILPWLIIDDPVQSMDEVHISQFAALLRTLSKQKERQIVIAVHERPLFEYLALELSPAFPEDRLITIELGRTANGMTTVNYEPRIYIPDRAIAM